MANEEQETVLTLVTRNPWKVRIARETIENRYGIKLLPTKVDTIEIQSDDPEVIARESARDAATKIGRPVIKCDAGISISALNGFPGPYSNYIERTIGEDGLARLVSDLSDKSAKIFSVVAYCEPNQEPVSFYGETRGKIIEEKRGTHGYFFDFIFVPDGYDNVLAEFDDSRRWEFWRDSFEKFAQWYTQKK